jgi:hypothetical protein
MKTAIITITAIIATDFTTIMLVDFMIFSIDLLLFVA